MSAVSVDATLRWRDRYILSSVSDCVMVVTGISIGNDWTHSGSGLPRRGGSVVDECADFAGWVGGGGGHCRCGDVPGRSMMADVCGDGVDVADCCWGGMSPAVFVDGCCC